MHRRLHVHYQDPVLVFSLESTLAGAAAKGSIPGRPTFTCWLWDFALLLLLEPQLFCRSSLLFLSLSLGLSHGLDVRPQFVVCRRDLCLARGHPFTNDFPGLLKSLIEM